jgi:hypothetical protein
MTPEEQKAADAKKVAEDKKLADEAVALQKEAAAELAKIPVVIVGGPGVFNIDGPGLGTAGRLTIGGHDVATTRWEDRTIRGEIQPGLKGEVILTNSNGLVRKGVYPYVRPVVVKVTTVTVEPAKSA